MGWWKIDGPGGAINWDVLSEAGNLLNAIPGHSTGENHYNGDEPADIIEAAVEELRESLNLSEHQMREIGSGEMAAFLLDPERDRLGGVCISTKQRQLVRAVWEEVGRCYQEAWGRPPYPEEKVAAVSFATGSIEEDDGAE